MSTNQMTGRWKLLQAAVDKQKAEQAARDKAKQKRDDEFFRKAEAEWQRKHGNDERRQR